jgi:hypothetical protein
MAMGRHSNTNIRCIYKWSKALVLRANVGGLKTFVYTEYSISVACKLNNVARKQKLNNLKMGLP